MPVLLIMLIIYAIIGNRKNIFSAKQYDIVKKVIFVFILLTLFGWVAPVLFVLSFLFAPFVIAGFVIWLIKNKNKNVQPVNQADDASGKFVYNDAKAKIKSSILPKEASKRRKIIEKFNKKYDLLLTDSQIQRIVDASYYSPHWEREIADMNTEYDSVYQWFSGNTAWLRAYLKAFKVQSVSSDFNMQKDICLSEYDQIFASMDFSEFVTQEDAIRELNNTFFTGFDDISFMIAYRFLESNGRHYNLVSRDVVRNEDEADVLARKYDRMQMN